MSQSDTADRQTNPGLPVARQGTVSRLARGGGLQRLGWTAASLVVLIAVWQIAAVALASRVFPGPGVVLATFVHEVQTGALLTHVGATLLRVIVSFFLAMIVGTAIGLALGSSKRADRFFDSWLIFFLNLPALVIIILCYVWFGLTEVAAITAVAVNKIPNVAVQVREGVRSLSKDLAEMAAVYRFGWAKTLRHVTLPQLAPFFLAAARSGLALVWKIVLVVELLGRSNGVGHQMQVAFSMFDVPMILAYAIAFIAVVQAIETGVLQPLEARAQRWRR
jgi:NitT/TauT family transport system permease protein